MSDESIDINSFPFVEGDSVVCIKEYGNNYGNIIIGGKYKIGGFGFTDDMRYRYIGVFIEILDESDDFSSCLHFNFNKNHDRYFFDHFVSISEYRNLKIDKIVEEW